jgi:hypothetical protein
MQFDVAGARAAGYSDAEIADHLASTSQFDAPKARSVGYSDAEIIGHLSAQKPAITGSQGPSQPLKIGVEGLADTVREEMKGRGWAERNMIGMGTAVTDLYEGAKQLFGQGNRGNIEANRAIAEESPIGALAGNVAVTALPGVGQLAKAGTGFGTAAGIGAGLGALRVT